MPESLLMKLPWLVLFAPLLAAVAIMCLCGDRRGCSAVLSIGAIVASLVGSACLFAAYHGKVVPEHPLIWLQVGDPIAAGSLTFDFGFQLDNLSLAMLLIVTGVGGLIHIYSWGYMREDRAVPRYFACLSLFTFSMLGIVLANNLVQLFIFWELVGVSSYLLIGHWFEKPSAADAAKKAFLANRIGDFGFLLGILIVWGALGTVSFGSLPAAVEANREAFGAVATAAGLLIFCGCVGKSAQFPLHVWLPDAMEGPTPVSALIHAATMVAAGVYLLCRVFFLFTPDALLVIAWTGGITALIAALMAVQQNDIKRILAYSTLSQLGYMVMAVGVGGPSAAMFHLTTHAFFKALLFLGAGSVILALHHEQDIWKMGGLRNRMPVTFWTFLIGTLALSGMPPFSGFFSKDEILAHAFGENRALFLLGTGVAMLTAFYMIRLVLVAFTGTARSDAASHAHESPAVMTVPLVILAALSIAGGAIGLADHPFGEFASALHPAASAGTVAMICGTLAMLLGMTLAWRCYRKATTDPLPDKLGAPARWMRDRFYFDELYAWLNRWTQELLSHAANFADRWLIAGAGVRGVSGLTQLTGSALRLFQTGNLQTYALLFAAGLLLLLYLFL